MPEISMMAALKAVNSAHFRAATGCGDGSRRWVELTPAPRGKSLMAELESARLSRCRGLRSPPVATADRSFGGGPWPSPPVNHVRHRVRPNMLLDGPFLTNPLFGMKAVEQAPARGVRSVLGDGYVGMNVNSAAATGAPAGIDSFRHRSRRCRGHYCAYREIRFVF